MTICDGCYCKVYDDGTDYCCSITKADVDYIDGHYFVGKWNNGKRTPLDCPLDHMVLKDGTVFRPETTDG